MLQIDQKIDRPPHRHLRVCYKFINRWTGHHITSYEHVTNSSTDEQVTTSPAMSMLQIRQQMNRPPHHQLWACYKFINKWTSHHITSYEHVTNSSTDEQPPHHQLWACYKFVNRWTGHHIANYEHVTNSTKDEQATTSPTMSMLQIRQQMNRPPHPQLWACYKFVNRWTGPHITSYEHVTNSSADEQAPTSPTMSMLQIRQQMNRPPNRQLWACYKFVNRWTGHHIPNYEHVTNSSTDEQATTSPAMYMLQINQQMSMINKPLPTSPAMSMLQQTTRSQHYVLYVQHHLFWPAYLRVFMACSSVDHVVAFHLWVIWGPADLLVMLSN